MFGLGGPVLAALGLLAGLCAGLGWYVTHLLERQGATEAQMQQLEAVNAAALAAAGRLTQENARLDAAMAARGRAGADIERRAGVARRRLDDALQSAPEWADSPVPSVVGGLLADDGGGADRSDAGSSPVSVDAAPPRANVPGGP